MSFVENCHATYTSCLQSNKIKTKLIQVIISNDAVGFLFWEDVGSAVKGRKNVGMCLIPCQNIEYYRILDFSDSVTSPV